MPLYIPSPAVNGFHVGAAYIHFYGLMYVVGITLAILITQRRWKAVGGDPSLVGDVALWAVPAGIIGGRIYFDLTTPTYIYELIFDLALAAFLVWLGHHRSVRPPGLFALYVTGYSAFRIFEESLRVDPSEHFLGLRFNMYVAIILTIAGAAWFWYTQRRRPATAGAEGVAGPPPA